MANRLIRYDAALLRRALADAFGGVRDMLLLALVAVIAVAWLRQQMLSALPGALWFAALAGPAGLAWHRLARLRLARLAEHSPVAAAALDGRERRAWLAVAHLILGLPLLAAALLLGVATGRPWAAVGLGVAAYIVGASMASVPPILRWRLETRRNTLSVAPLGSGTRAVFALVLARQTLGARQPLLRAGLLLLASFLVTVLASWWGRGLPAPLAFVPLLLPSLAVLLLSMRLDAALLGFLPSAGYRPGFIALTVSALPAGSCLVGGAAFLVTGQGPGLLAMLALSHLALALVNVARAWLYPGRTMRSVDVQLQLEVAGLVALAVLLPPLAIAAAGWRYWHYYRHCRAKRWMRA